MAGNDNRYVDGVVVFSNEKNVEKQVCFWHISCLLRLCYWLKITPEHLAENTVIQSNVRKVKLPEGGWLCAKRIGECSDEPWVFKSAYLLYLEDVPENSEYRKVFNAYVADNLIVQAVKTDDFHMKGVNESISTLPYEECGAWLLKKPAIPIPLAWMKFTVQRDPQAAKYLYQGESAIGKDNKEALRLLRLAVELDDEDAMYYLGTMYERGRGVDKDIEEAIRWYRKAVEGGSPLGMEKLAQLCENGENGVEQDLQEAFRLRKLAAESGYSMIMAVLAEMYEKGNGTEVDLKLARYWYQEAADRSVSIAKKWLKEHPEEDSQ